MDFKIAKVYYHDVKDIYPGLYNDIFKEIDSRQLPNYVYLGWYKGKYVGFMSAYIHDLDSVCIQYAGFNDGFKGYIAVKLFREVIAYVHKDYKCIQCSIRNTNVPALKVAMNTGFIITGMRIGGEMKDDLFHGDLYIELSKNIDTNFTNLHELKENENGTI